MLRILIVFSLFLPASIRAQSSAASYPCSKGFAACIAKKTAAANCFPLYYRQADSFLNAAYSRLSASCDSSGKINLRDEQRYWLRKRDLFRKEQGSAATLIRMVEERAAELGFRSPADYAPGAYAADPTGTYAISFSNGSRPHSGPPYGKIYAEPVSPGFVFVNLKYDAGPPANGLGIIRDTLPISNGTAVFTTREDSSCRVLLHFAKNGVTVEQQSQAFSFGCGFGRNVHVDGFYERVLPAGSTLRIGEHRIGVQWLEPGKPGKARVSRVSDDRFKISGQQSGETKDDYLRIDGTLTVVSNRKLLFEGSILLKYSFINRGKECRREGRFHFTAPDGKKYWRLEEQRTCGDVTDYIDLYF